MDLEEGEKRRRLIKATFYVIIVENVAISKICATLIPTEENLEMMKHNLSKRSRMILGKFY